MKELIITTKKKMVEQVNKLFSVEAPNAITAFVNDYEFFDHVVKMCFAQRRKTLANNLKTLIKDKDEREKLINDLGLDARVRPEELTLNQFVQLAHLLKDRQA